MKRLLLLCAAGLGLACGCQQQCPESALRLGAIFSDHAVLQRGKPLPVWGWDTPGQEVRVRMAGQTATALAGPGGKWMARLPPLPAGGPHVLTVEGTGCLERRDILIGEVWICSGQSNMEWPVRRAADAEAEIAAARHGKIRLLTVPKTAAAVSRWDFDGSWSVCSPEAIADFSAVGYFFGRQIHQALDGVPVGLIHASWSGSRIEPWVPRRALARSEVFGPRLAEMDLLIREYAGREHEFDAIYADTMAGYREELGKFLDFVESQDAGRRQKWHDPRLQETDWTSVTLPGPWEKANLPGFDGVVWYRRKVEIPQAWAGKPLTLSLGPIDDTDEAYFNGRRVGRTGYDVPDPHTRSRVYEVSADLVHAGTNTLAVRVVDLRGAGGLTGIASDMTLRPKDDPQAEPIALDGYWSSRAGFRVEKGAAPRAPKKVEAPGCGFRDLASMHNGMIAPLTPYAIAGVVWYQGESNAGQPQEYRELLDLLIRGWRYEWQQVDDFGFYIVQLANFTPVAREPNQGGWAWIREVQAQTAQRLPQCGLAVSIDVGEADDVHPADKQTVGRRLALQALAKTYRHDVPHSGPVYQSHVIRDGRAVVTFAHDEGGLVAHGETLNGFIIADKDHAWHWASAKIEDGKVVIWSDDVSEPTAVRYAWATNPGPVNLYNGAGLPAVPFRTDTWEIDSLKP